MHHAVVNVEGIRREPDEIPFVPASVPALEGEFLPGPPMLDFLAPLLVLEFLGLGKDLYMAQQREA